MIKITQINGKVVVVNAEMISHLESAGNTIITLVTGNKFVALETLDEVMKRVIDYKKQINQQLPQINNNHDQ